MSKPRKKAPTVGGIQWREQEALRFAMDFGPACLARHGLKYHHFTEERGRVWTAIGVSAAEQPDGRPLFPRIRELLQDKESGVAAELVEPLLLEIPVNGTGCGPDKAQWYAQELIAAWGARETTIVAGLLLAAAETGDLAAVDGLTERLGRIKKKAAAGSQPPLIEVYSPSQIKAYRAPEGFSLVGDNHIFCGSLSVIAGPPGAGKSRVLSSLAQAGAIGAGTWMGLAVHRKFRTLVIQGENGRERLRAELEEFDVPGMDEYIRISGPPECGLAFDDPDFQAALRELYADFKPDVVCIDPWSQVAKDDKGKDYRAGLTSIRECFPAGDRAPAIIIVAHTRKPREDERSNGRALLNVIAGSFILGASARSAFVLQHATDDTEEDRVVWTPCKNNDGELGPRSAWYRRNGLFERCLDFDWSEFDGSDRKRPTVTAENIAHVFADGKPLTKAEAAKKLEALTGVSRATAFRALDPRSGKFPGLEDTGAGLLRLSQSQIPIGVVRLRQSA